MKELVLHEINAMYRILFDSIAEGFILVDSSGSVVLSNPRCEELFACEEGALIGKKIEDLLPNSLRSDHVQKRQEFHSSPQKRSMGRGMNLQAQRMDGTLFYVEISLNHLKMNEEIYVSALITDISERAEQERQIKELNQDLETKVKERTYEVQKSQELYSTIARNFPNGTINVFDRDLNYIFVEGKELFQMGITSEKLIGTNYLEKINKVIRPQIKSALLAVFRGESQDFEIDLKDQCYHINAVPLKSNNNQIERILVVEKNITPQKLILQQQEEALKKERNLNEMKSRFVSMASHEFRTPLSTILSSTSLIEKYLAENMPEKTVKHTNRIRSSVQGLTEILNDFLSVDKLETQPTPVSIHPFNYLQFVSDIAEEMNAVSKEGQEIIVEIAPGIKTISTDQKLLKNILYNLMSNAIKYSHEGQPIIFKSIISNNTLIITIQDFGIGIPKGDYNQMFGRFFRAKNAINIKGTGLGLNIVQKYLEMLEGSISFESEEDKGSKFILNVPINYED